MKKIALIAPSATSVSNMRMENLSLGYLAAMLRSMEYEVKIYDVALTKLSNLDVVNEIIANQFDIVGISLSSSIFISDTKLIINKLREKLASVHICLGGYLATSSPEILFELNADCLIYGEGEFVFKKIVQLLNENQEWKMLNQLAYLNQKNKLVIKACPHKEISS